MPSTHTAEGELVEGSSFLGDPAQIDWISTLPGDTLYFERPAVLPLVKRKFNTLRIEDRKPIGGLTYIDGNSALPRRYRIAKANSKKQGKKRNFQQGGQLNMNEQQLQQAFIQYLAQKLGVKSQEELEAAIQQMGEEGLRQAYAEFMQVMQQQLVQAAKFGAKLNYLKNLRGLCPEGYEMGYFKQGGTVCKKCMKKQIGGDIESSDPVTNFKQIRAAKCGKKMKKSECGSKMKKGEEGLALEKCGGKTKLKKKCEFGGLISSNKCGGKTKKKACGGQVKKNLKGTQFNKPSRTISGIRTNNNDLNNGILRSTIKWNDGTKSRMETDEEGTVYRGRRGEIGITNVPNARLNAIADSLYKADGWGMKNPKTFPLKSKNK